jgi:hypothetical protein
MMIAARLYTSGRIAVANLSALIDSLELRGVEGATFDHLSPRLAVDYPHSCPPEEKPR